MRDLIADVVELLRLKLRCRKNKCARWNLNTKTEIRKKSDTKNCYMTFLS